MTARNYDMDDALLLQRSRTVRQLFINYMAAFMAFDPDLDATYAANWLLSIEECRDHPTDETTVDQQQQHTDELEQAIKEGFAAANDLEYYVKKAFPGDKSYREEFGFGERTKARQRTLNLLIWLEVMIKIANDYPAELAAVNMPASVLTNLQAKQQNAVQKEIAQEYFKRMRKRLARQRVKNFNTLYGFFTRINNAAQIVFANEKEERELFELG